MTFVYGRYEFDQANANRIARCLQEAAADDEDAITKCQTETFGAVEIDNNEIYCK